VIHQVSFGDGHVSYRNRFVRTDGLLAEQEAGRSLWAGIAENPDVALRPDGWGARGRMKDAASTDVIVHAGVVVASFYQCGDLYRLDPLTLNDMPLFREPELPARGLYAARFHPEIPSRLGVIPRRGGSGGIRWFSFEPTYVLHWTNAYESGASWPRTSCRPGCTAGG
jgi:carotenoid cleavage dioxygenase-like enzyme